MQSKPKAKPKPFERIREDGERRHIQMSENLLNVSREVTAVESLEEVLESLVEVTTRTLKAERGTIFLNDKESNELFSRVAMGELTRTIRLHNTSGIAGHVFTSSEALIINNVDVDERFNPEIDRVTGYITRNILCAPIRTFDGETIGVAQILNKKAGKFNNNDIKILESMTRQASVTLLSSQIIERMQVNRVKELEFLDMVVNITSEIDLTKVLNMVMREVTKMLNAERSMLFLNDEETDELWGKVGESAKSPHIRFPNHKGIAGSVFTTGKTVIIPHAYADIRFNPALDKETGFFTRSILCTPLINKKGKIIGVTQVLNKRGSTFTDEDSSRLRAFTAQVSIALENAKLVVDLEELLIGVVKSLAGTIEAKSRWTKGHSDRVTKIAVKIGRELELKESELKTLEITGLLHDIGKIGTYGSILNKKDKLTEEETKIMQKHPGRGADLLEHIKKLKEVLPGVRYHHECYDGTGYPEGLKGEKIPFFARIIAVADTADAMGADRPYRKGLSMEIIADEMKRCSGTQFDRKIVKAYLKIQNKD